MWSVTLVFSRRNTSVQHNARLKRKKRNEDKLEFCTTISNCDAHQDMDLEVSQRVLVGCEGISLRPARPSARTLVLPGMLKVPVLIHGRVIRSTLDSWDYFAVGNDNSKS